MNQRAQHWVLPATVEMDVHRGGGRRDGDSDDVDGARSGEGRTAQTVDEGRQTDASNHNSLFSLSCGSRHVALLIQSLTVRVTQ